MITGLARLGGILLFALALVTANPNPAPAAGSDDQPLWTVDELPAELSLLISASVLTLRGETGPETIQFVDISPEAAAGLRDPNFAYQNFALVGTGLRDWGVSPDDPSLATVNALLVFADRLGRRATVLLVVDYRITGKGVEIKNAVTLTMAPPNPESRLYVVPAKNFPDRLLNQGVGQLELFRNVAERAIGGGGGKAPSTPEDYYVFAFAVDRLHGDSKYQLLVSDRATGVDGDTGNTVTADFLGWRVAVLRGEFTLGSGPELFFKTIYTPAPGETDGPVKARLAEVFSSHGPSKAGGK